MSNIQHCAFCAHKEKDMEEFRGKYFCKECYELNTAAVAVSPTCYNSGDVLVLKILVNIYRRLKVLERGEK